MVEKKIPYDRLTYPPGLNEDGTFSGIEVTGTKRFESKEEEQKDKETAKRIRRMFEERIKKSKKK